MNLTQPPFDDIHVRRAMNWIIDKAALRQVWGGPLLGKIAGPHRPRLDLRQPARGVRPVRDARRPRQPREGEGGDEGLEVRHRARRDVQRSRLPQRPAAHRHAASTFQRMLPIVEADAAKIGITFHVSTDRRAPIPTLQTTSKNIAIAIFPGWVKDYADALTFFKPLFDGRTIIPQGNTNYSLVGLQAVAGEGARRDGHDQRRPERRLPARPLRGARRPGAALLLRGASTGR